MPIYEFRCTGCNRKFERLCRMGQTDGICCPDCGESADRLFSTFFSRSSSSDGSPPSGKSCAGCTSTSCSTCR